jgi:Spy/CpxP family protein refolding chaperone
MKKTIIAVVLITGLTMATIASAGWGRHGNWDNGCTNYGGRQMMMNAPADAATQAKMQQFYKDNLDLHKQMAMKQAEKRALLMSDQPDPAAAAKVAGELFDLHTTLMEKAEAAGVDQFIGPQMRGPRGGQGGPFCQGNGPGQGRKRMN